MGVVDFRDVTEDSVVIDFEEENMDDEEDGDDLKEFTILVIKAEEARESGVLVSMTS